MAGHPKRNIITVFESGTVKEDQNIGFHDR